VSRPVASILPSTSQSTSSSFENFTLPLMETPLDKVPPVRAVSGAPFPAAGFGAAGGVVGSVAAIGMAGSTFRLLENICMILDSFDWRSRKHHPRQALSGQPFVCVLTESANELGFSSANGEEVEDGAAQTEGGGAEEIRGGADFPQPRAEDRGDADNEIAHEIVSADQLSAPLGCAVTDDGSFARGVAKFLQPANRKRHDEHGEAAGKPERHGKEREESERREDERLAPMLIGKIRDRNKAKTRHDDLHRGQNADPLRAHAHVIHSVNADPR